MSSQDPSAVRKALMWWFHWPGNPYVCVSAAVDFAPANAYLAGLNADDGVTVQHLLAAAIGKVFSEYPEANARIVRNRIRRLERVDIAMPVSLRSHASGDRHDLSLAVIEGVDTLTLREVARACRDRVGSTRAGRPENALVRWLTRLVDHTPYPVLARGLDLADWLVQRPGLAAEFNRHFTVSTAITNPGAAFGRVEGALFRGASMEVPQRLFHVGTIWGVSALQDEVIALDGKPAVRPVLPVVLCFDHRLFDGIVAGEILSRFAAILREPAEHLGTDGSTS